VVSTTDDARAEGVKRREQLRATTSMRAGKDDGDDWGNDEDETTFAAEARTTREDVEDARRRALEERAKNEERRRGRNKIIATTTSRAALESHRRREEAKKFDPRAATRREYERGSSSTTSMFSRADDGGVDVDENETFEEHEARWSAFEADVGRITLRDIPWPRSGSWLLRALERALPSNDDPKRAHRALAKRWHPDKFVQRFGTRIDEHEKPAIDARVKDVYQSAQQLWDATVRRDHRL